MASRNFMIDDRQLARYINKLALVDKKVATRTAKVLRVMTKYTEKQMKKYSRSRSSRATGNLSSSITASYTLTNTSVSSQVYVPSSIKYQFASEYGIRRNQVISGKPTMTFSASSWKRASSSVKVPHRGYFVFTQVKRGKYAGKYFTKKAFEDLQNLYRTKIENQLSTQVMFDLGGI